MAHQGIIDRRELLRGGLWIGAGLAASQMLPFDAAEARARRRARQPFVVAPHLTLPAVTAGIEGYISARKVPGMAALVGRSTATGTLVALGKQAFDDATAVDANSLFRAYSMTKPITGMAAMMLIDEGKMRLDQPIADFLPEFANMRVVTGPDTLDSVPAERQITIRHLLTHTAGLGYTIITKGPLLNEYSRLGLNPASISRTPLPGFAAMAPTPGAAEFCRRLATLPLMYQPGKQWSYSVSLDVLGHIVALASGAPSFERFLADRMFGPLGMTSSFFQVPADQVRRLTTVYAPVGGIPIPLDHGRNSVFADPPAFAFGGSGLVTSARDYDRFLAMLLGYGKLGNTRIMSEGAVRQGTSNLLPEGTITTGTYIAGEHFGAGGRVGVAGPAEGSFGWSGAAGTMGWVDMRRSIRASGWAQFFPSSAYPFLAEFPRWVLEDLAAMRVAA